MTLGRRRGPDRLIAALGLIGALSLGLTGEADGMPAVASASTFCGLTGFSPAHSFVWTGAAGDDSWQTAGNWNLGGAPATSPPGNPYDPNGPGNFDTPARDTDYVCIGNEPGGSPAKVILGGTFYAGAAIAVLDLGQNASLTVTGNSRLWLNRTQTSTQPSNVRAGSALNLAGATLGGAGNLVVAGTLDAATTAAFPVTITTRWCDVGATCSAPPIARGRITIQAGGRLLVDGAPAGSKFGGINLEDERDISNAGTIKLANKGFIAADYGTTIENSAGGVITITNNLGIYEGRNHFGAAPALTNSGRLAKTTGIGASVIGAKYTQTSSATVGITTGTLSLGQSTRTSGVVIPTATVAQAGSYGLGSCPAVTNGNPGGCSSPTVSSVSPQAATVTLGASAGSSTVSIATQTTGLPSGSIGQAVQIQTPSAHPSTTKPSIFTLYYHRSLVNGATLAQFKMKRAEDNSTTFAAVPNCLSTGAPPSGNSSCVDERNIAGVSSQIMSNGAAKIVIRTTQNSRWVAV